MYQKMFKEINFFISNILVDLLLIGIFNIIVLILKFILVK